jgi:hypothetical protein
VERVRDEDQRREAKLVGMDWRHKERGSGQSKQEGVAGTGGIVRLGLLGWGLA